MKVLIIGANGQLGTDMVRAMSDWDIIPVTHAELDVCDFVAVRKAVTRGKQDAVMNTAAFHRVDACEEQLEKAFGVNAYAVRNLAQVCRDVDCTLAHISTDYVFGGEKRTPYGEDDLPNPLNIYGVSKLAGEYFVRNICPRHFIVRTSGLHGVAGSSGKGGNFVETMIRLAREGKPIRVVKDQVLSPTYAKDLAEKLKELLQTDGYGTYHITNSGSCSWYEFAAKTFALLDLNPQFTPTTAAEFGAKGRRPAYSVLANNGLRKLQLERLRPWTEALSAYLQERGHLHP